MTHYLSRGVDELLKGHQTERPSVSRPFEGGEAPLQVGVQRLEHHAFHIPQRKGEGGS